VFHLEYLLYLFRPHPSCNILTSPRQLVQPSQAIQKSPRSVDFLSHSLSEAAVFGTRWQHIPSTVTSFKTTTCTFSQSAESLNTQSSKDFLFAILHCYGTQYLDFQDATRQNNCSNRPSSSYPSRPIQTTHNESTRVLH